MNREYNEHYSFFQVSDRPIGLMETRHLNGLCVRRLGRRLGLVANLGYRRADNNLSGPRRLKEDLADADPAREANAKQDHLLMALTLRTEQFDDETVGRPASVYCRLGFST
jgi:hypothetical protein